MTPSSAANPVGAALPGSPGRGRVHSLRQIRATELSGADIAMWLGLEARALEPNAYLSAHFVVPAMRHLDGGAQTVLTFLEEHHPGGTELQAVAVLQPRWCARTMPLPHRRAFLSPHSFLSGILVARDDAKRHLAALCTHLRGQGGHGLVFESCRVDGATDRLLHEVAVESGLQRTESDAYLRAAMKPADMGEAYLAGPLSSRNKKLRSQRSKLGKLGAVHFEVLAGSAVDDAAIERHLALEHMGWKGENGTSMRSNPAHEAFFREMAAGFAADGRALFAQLSVGHRVIASTSNFIAGNAGFAFKIGSDPEFSHYAPGIMCELEFLRCAPSVAGTLDCFDSGSTAGSYLEGMWPHRHAIATVTYSTSVAGRLAMACRSQLRRLKRSVANREAHEVDAAAQLKAHSAE